MVTSDKNLPRDPDSERDKYTILDENDESDTKLLSANGDIGAEHVSNDTRDVTVVQNDVNASQNDTKVPVGAEQSSEPARRKPTAVPIDRGWAWMVMLGALLEMMIVIGLLKSAGILFIAFQSRFRSSSSMTSLVSTVQQAVYSITAPFVMTIGVKMLSCRMLLYAGSVITLVAYVITSQAEDIRLVMFSHGVLHGLGTAFMQTCSISMVGQYFDKRRGLANGIAVSGGSLGGLIFAPLLTNLLDYYGYSGCFLLTGAMTFHCCVSGALFRPQEFYTKLQIKKTTKENIDEEKHCDSQQILRHVLTNISELDEEQNGVDINDRNVECREQVMTSKTTCESNASSAEVNHVAVKKRELDTVESEQSTPFIVITLAEDTIAHKNKQLIVEVDKDTDSGDLDDTNDIFTQEESISGSKSLTDLPNKDKADGRMVDGTDALSLLDTDVDDKFSKSAEHINLLNSQRYDDIHDTDYFRPRTMSSPASTQKPAFKRKRLFSGPAVEPYQSSPNTFRRRLQNFRDRSNTAHNIGRLVQSLSKSGSELYTSSEFIVGSIFDVPNVSRQIPETTEEETEEEKRKPWYKRMYSSLSNIFDFQLIRNPVFVVFTISAGLLCASSAMTTVYIAPYAREIGLTNKDVAVILTVYSAIDMCSRIIVGIIADRDWMRRSTIIGIAGLIIGATAQLLRWYVNYKWLMLYTVILGLVSGVYFSLFAVVIVDYMTVAKLQSCIGFTILSHGAFASMSFALLGYARDQSGSYVLPFHLIGAMSTIGAVMMMSLPIFQKLQQRKQKPKTETLIR